MAVELSIVESLNHWGEHHRTLIRVCSNDLVYVALVLAIVWFCAKLLSTYPISEGWRDSLFNLVFKGVFIFGIPVGIATLLSETISAIFVRQRPFAAHSSILLLVPHAADGGMPSHHVVFMVALATTVYFYEKKVAITVALLTLVSGVARVAAGIHYPSDLLVGALLGVFVAYLFHSLLARDSRSRFNKWFSFDVLA
jgi:undecaprenyl-diphosphatase